MKVVIAGAGKFGSKLIDIFLKNGHKVSVIENNEEIAKRISEEYGILVIKGDCTDTYSLEEAGIKDADLFVAATSREDTNTFSAMIAATYNVKKIVVRLNSENFINILKKVGIDYYFLPEKEAAEIFYSTYCNPNIKSSLKLSEKYSLIVLKASKDLNIIGKQIEKLNKNSNLNILGIIKKDGNFNNNPKAFIEENDLLIAIIKRENIDKILESL